MDLNELKKIFIKSFGPGGGDIRIFAAPGRVNIIGDHTDYNGGYVFPAALSMETRIIARARNDRKMNLAATTVKDTVTLDLERSGDYMGLKWGNYQVGVAHILIEEGFDILGADMLYETTVPFGSGLSSSASIEVATAIALINLNRSRNESKFPMDPIKIAVMCRKTENRYCYREG